MYESEHEMTKFTIFTKKMKKIKCKIVNFSNCKELIAKSRGRKR